MAIRFVSIHIFLVRSVLINIFYISTQYFSRTLSAINPEFLYLNVLHIILPNIINHAMHTNIAVLVIIEMILSTSTYPCRKSGIFTLGSANILYIIWAHIVFFVSGVWSYPILDTALNRHLLIVSFVIAGFVFYYLGEILSRIMNVGKMERMKRLKFA